jgi:endoglucanase
MKTAVSIKSSLLEAFFLLCLFFLAGSESHAGAYEQNRKLGRGVNIIGYDRIWASFDERRFKEAHFQLIKEAGFDSVRINVHAFRHMDKDHDYALSDHFYQVLDWAVSHALKNGLAVIIDMHEFNAMGDDPEGTKEMLFSFWRQVASHYKDAPSEVMFEILNEPCRGVTPELWNAYMHKSLAIIRQSNPTRTVVIGPASWNSVNSLDTLDLPADDRNIIATVHYYSPFNFTHQGASWSQHKDETGVKWSGSDEEKQAIVDDLSKAQAWAQKHDRPLFLGEFGVFDKAEMASRVRYLEYLTQTVESLGWSWAYWQFDKDFVLYDIDKGAWNEPVKNAILPQGPVDAVPYYTTRGRDIIDSQTGQPVVLKGFGIGGWLLPEGYMWGIRKLDRPRHFEAAIEELIGKEDAQKFWKVYHDNYTTEQDFKAMKQMGVDTIRIPLLASKLLPRDGQPSKPPYQYSADGFRYLDKVVAWGETYKLGIIWDMHGAPGGQNAENISDSDGVARLWTEKEIYWPRSLELWKRIAKRYADKRCIVGYDLLNEPLLARYDGIDVTLLREHYVELTKAIRKIDADGIIFVEGDEWAQDFKTLEPLDWDDHLVVAFHSYPPTAKAEEMKHLEALRQTYNVPLWHGETGEQGPPYDHNRKSTKYLNANNIGWNWWTHKKFERATQPWLVVRTEGFDKLLAYWNGQGPKPSKADAKKWLFEQAEQIKTENCLFLPEMVDSLEGLDVENYLSHLGELAPKVLRGPEDAETEVNDSTNMVVYASGHPLNYRWSKDGKEIPGAKSSRLRIVQPGLDDDGSVYRVKVYNDLGEALSDEAQLTVKPFSGPSIVSVKTKPVIDGQADDPWKGGKANAITKKVYGKKVSADDVSGAFSMMWDDENLYILLTVTDDAKVHTGEWGHNNDSVEIYIDLGNQKLDSYGKTDYQIRCEWSKEGISVPIGRQLYDVTVAQADFDDGYAMEFAIPWRNLGGEVGEGDFIGIDVHINDNDKHSRETKLAWYASRDNSYRSPMLFGTAKLVLGNKE